MIEVATPVTTMPSVAGVRLLGAVPSGGPVARVPAVRDGVPVWFILVTADLDAPLRRRVRTESADLEALFTRLQSAPVLPLTDHGQDDDGRPFVLSARPGPTLRETLDGPASPAVVLAAARALAEGLSALAGQGLIGPPSDICRGSDGTLLLSAPLPPAIAELESALGDGTGDEPPEVLAGGDWSPAGQTYACASMLWTLLAGKPPYSGQDQKLARLTGAPPKPFERAGVNEALVDVLRSALAFDPATRPSDPRVLAAALEKASPAPVAHHPTIPPRNPAVWQLGSRYELVSRIGGGASGQVWSGRRREDGLPVAVKILRRELSEDPQTVDRFLRESRILQSIRHPNVVEIHDFVKEGEVFGIVMELVEGEDLRHVAARGPLRVTEAAELLAQSASALAAVHAAGIVHRDVKPENILVTDHDGRRTAYLSDFGIARAIAGSAHTQLLGTPAYLGPELWAGRSPTTATDIYALGITAYQLLAGHLPFDANSQEGMMRAHLEQVVSRPDGLDDAAWALITACMERAPARRPDSAQVAAGWASLAGSAVLAGLTIPPPATPPAAVADREPDRDPAHGTVMSARALPRRPEPPAPPRKRRRVPILVLLAAALAGIGGGVVFATQHHGGAPKKLDTTPSAKLGYYPVPASTVVSGSTATLTWSKQTDSLPGFAGYVVSDVSGRPVSRVLAKGVNSFTVHGLRAGRQSCFVVLTLATAPPPGPAAQPATCVTPPPRPRNS